VQPFEDHDAAWAGNLNIQHRLYFALGLGRQYMVQLTPSQLLGP
jgi:hypothetical protein